MQTIAGQRVPLDFVVNWMVANLYFVRESITDSPESWWYLTVPNSDSETDYAFRDEEDRFEQFSKNRPLVRGENLILSICYSLFRDFEIEISLPTREREREKGKKKSTRYLTFLSPNNPAKPTSVDISICRCQV